MRVETIPLILGVLTALVGLGLLADAWLPEDMPIRRPERRRAEREERHLGGEAAIGVGVLCMAAVLLGRDTWSYGTVVIIIGAVLLASGTWLNRRFLRDRVVNRGALRRGEPSPPKPRNSDPPPGKTRIR
jgi:hypothetical protein